MSGISPRLPLSFEDGGISLNKTLPESIRQNLKNLFLTNPGERMMDPAFGIGLKKFLFEQNLDSTYSKIRTAALQQTKKYMPFVNLSDIRITTDSVDSNIIYVAVFYLITPLNQTDSLNLKVQP